MFISNLPCSSPFRLPIQILVSVFLSASFAAGQGGTSCTLGSNALQVRAEGLTEKVGDIILTCTGGTSGSTSTATLYVSTNVSITNRLDSSGRPVGISISTDVGSGPAANVVNASFASANTLILSGIQYRIPTPSTQNVTIRISNIRVAVAPLAAANTAISVTASVGATGIQLTDPQDLTLAFWSPSLLSSSVVNLISCNVSATPATYDFPGLLAAGISSSSVRVTESSTYGFGAKEAGADTGIRIILSASGYTSANRIFVPDVLVGNTGNVPTSGGAFGTNANAGTYTPGSGQLLLIRINGADSSGVGGVAAIPAPGAQVTFSSLTELQLVNGVATAVYEVFDSNPNLRETLQIPVFATQQSACATGVIPSLSAVIAPVSAVTTASATAPVPRFSAGVLASDCQQIGDCGAIYFPVLTVDTTPIALSAQSLGAVQNAYIPVRNTGQGYLSVSVSVSYQNGSNWLTISPSSGVNNFTIALSADPGPLQPGIYLANVTINAGTYGVVIVPVTLTVGPPGVTIQSIVNAASFQTGPVVPGSFAALFGVNLAGKNVSVTFDGFPSTVLFDSATQINLIIPAMLNPSGHSTGVIATVDGQSSSVFRMVTTPNEPGIFNPGIVNKDGTVNTAANPAKRGDFVQVYLTGFTLPLTGPVSVTIGGSPNLVPLYAGAQPTFPALDQVNVVVPQDLVLTGTSVPLTVCISAGTQVCSNPATLYLQ